MKEMNQGFCQCCGMPLDKPEDKGTEICVPNMAAANPDMDETEARKRMLEWFPTLKRWKKA